MKSKKIDSRISNHTRKLAPKEGHGDLAEDQNHDRNLQKQHLSALRDLQEQFNGVLERSPFLIERVIPLVDLESHAQLPIEPVQRLAFPSDRWFVEEGEGGKDLFLGLQGRAQKADQPSRRGREAAS